MNVLLLTSCNRIKQTLLSLSLNVQIIKKPFSVIIVDNSTPGVEADIMCSRHRAEDPYNVVKPHNYCSDVDLLYDAKKYFDVENYKVIHCSPRLNKQRGDSTSIALGLMQASLIGDRRCRDEKNYCLKITGTSILKYDLVSLLPELLVDSDIVTWHRANIGGYERSTRVFGCRPDVLSSIVAKEGWSKWCDDETGVLEQRFAKIIEKELPGRINYTKNDENGILLEGGLAMQDSYGRERITKYIKDYNIQPLENPYIKEFLDGKIW
jgi:hypothetical protein